VPKLTSKAVAPDALHVSVALVLTPVAPLAGVGALGAAGGGGAAAVVNDHIGPVVAPLSFFATTCQKYAVPAARFPGAYDALA